MESHRWYCSAEGARQYLQILFSKQYVPNHCDTCSEREIIYVTAGKTDILSAEELLQGRYFYSPICQSDRGWYQNWPPGKLCYKFFRTTHDSEYLWKHNASQLLELKYCLPSKGKSSVVIWICLGTLIDAKKKHSVSLTDIMNLEIVHKNQPSSFPWLCHVSSSLCSGEHLEETNSMLCYASMPYCIASARQLTLQSCQESEL